MDPEIKESILKQYKPDEKWKKVIENRMEILQKKYRQRADSNKSQKLLRKGIKNICGRCSLQQVFSQDLLHFSYFMSHIDTKTVQRCVLSSSKLNQYPSPPTPVTFPKLNTELLFFQLCNLFFHISPFRPNFKHINQASPGNTEGVQAHSRWLFLKAVEVLEDEQEHSTKSPKACTTLRACLLPPPQDTPPRLQRHKINIHDKYDH